MDKSVRAVLAQLHTPRGRPRLEIGGAGEPSVEARCLLWLPDPEGRSGRVSLAERCVPDPEAVPVALYVLKDWYEDTSYVTAYDTEHVRFPRDVLERLVVEAAASPLHAASMTASGRHIIHQERFDDYSGLHGGGPPRVASVQVSLRLRLEDLEPRLDLSYRPQVPAK